VAHLGEWTVTVQIPDWARSVLDAYSTQEKPFPECEISGALNKAAKEKKDLSDEDRKCVLTEWSAFNFDGSRQRDSVWGIYFGPMMTGKRSDGIVFYSPDVKDLDAESFAHLEERAANCVNSVMRARYADLAWDMKNKAIAQRPNVEFARIAIDSYLEAIEKGRYEMEMFGVEWLARTLQLARSIKDDERTKRVVDAIFAFHDKVAEVGRAGTWIFLFDLLYGEKCIDADQETRIVAQLEEMFAKVTETKPSASGAHLADPFAAEAAADRLLRHYHRLKNRPNAERVMKVFGATFEDMARKANPMMSSIFLPRIIERYQQEGLKEDAERAQLLAQEKGKNIAGDMKTISVEATSKKRTLTISSRSWCCQVISKLLLRALVRILCQTLTQCGRCWNDYVPMLRS
jgi:lysyl-tRNA synthetase class 1